VRPLSLIVLGLLLSVAVVGLGFSLALMWKSFVRGREHARNMAKYEAEMAAYDVEFDEYDLEYDGLGEYGDYGVEYGEPTPSAPGTLYRASVLTPLRDKPVPRHAASAIRPPSVEAPSRSRPKEVVAILGDIAGIIGTLVALYLLFNPSK
jgi:hypothetical protein